MQRSCSARVQLPRLADLRKRTSFKSQKSYFCKEVHPCFWSKNAIFLSICFQSKKGLEIRFNDVLDRKETCFDYKNKIFKRLKNHIFSKGLTHAFRQKMEFFSGFVFGQKRTRNKV